jgi:hypothetical protein
MKQSEEKSRSSELELQTMTNANDFHHPLQKIHFLRLIIVIITQFPSSIAHQAMFFFSIIIIFRVEFNNLPLDFHYSIMTFCGHSVRRLPISLFNVIPTLSCIKEFRNRIQVFSPLRSFIRQQNSRNGRENVNKQLRRSFTVSLQYFA